MRTKTCTESIWIIRSVSQQNKRVYNKHQPIGMEHLCDWPAAQPISARISASHTQRYLKSRFLSVHVLTTFSAKARVAAGLHVCVGSVCVISVTDRYLLLFGLQLQGVRVRSLWHDSRGTNTDNKTGPPSTITRLLQCYCSIFP